MARIPALGKQRQRSSQVQSHYFKFILSEMGVCHIQHGLGPRKLTRGIRGIRKDRHSGQHAERREFNCKHWIPKPKLCTAQGRGSLVSEGGLQWQGVSPLGLSTSSRRMLKLLVFAHTAQLFLNTREGFASFPWVWGIGPAHRCAHVNRLHQLLTHWLRTSSGSQGVPNQPGLQGKTGRGQGGGGDSGRI